MPWLGRWVLLQTHYVRQSNVSGNSQIFRTVASSKKWKKINIFIFIKQIQSEFSLSNERKWPKSGLLLIIGWIEQMVNN